MKPRVKKAIFHRQASADGIASAEILLAKRTSHANDRGLHAFFESLRKSKPRK